MLFSLGNEEAESNARRARPLRLRRVQGRGERGRRQTPAGRGTRLCRGDRGEGRSGPARREEKEIIREVQLGRAVAMSGCGSLAERKGRGEPRVREGEQGEALVPSRSGGIGPERQPDGAAARLQV